jgi:hypothetical protein
MVQSQPKVRVLTDQRHGVDAAPRLNVTDFDAVCNLKHAVKQSFKVARQLHHWPA